MFGSKKDKDTDFDQTPLGSSTDTSASDSTALSQPKLQTDGLAVNADTNNSVRNSEDTSLAQTLSSNTPVSESKKRRSSSTAKAKEIFSQAKNSLIHGDKDGPQTPMQKLSKTDAALSVPQGSLNNSAGESHPTANSSFLVGVTEDKNKKCRRTMEDTHAYLYNFLGTPAPVLPSQASTKSRKSLDSESRLSQTATAQSDQSQHVVETDNGYFAVFDGHAGTFAAEWCGKKVHVLLEDLMRKNPNMPVPELLDQTYTSADQQLERLPLKNSGCTAITAVLRWEDRVPNGQSATGSTAVAPLAAQALKHVESEEAGTAESTSERKASTVEEAMQEVKQKATRQRVLYTANVGDARIVLCRNGKALRLSYDHKGADENEGRRISKAGGLILNNRVNGVLAVTRALGDSYLKDLVTGHPYTTETVIQPDQDEFLILACDGLWDVTSDQEAVDIIRNVQDPQKASRILVDHALARFSTDNLSVMVVRFDPNKLASNTATDIGVESDPASKEKGAVSEVEMIVAEARRNSGIPTNEGMTDETAEDASAMVIPEDEEPGPELDPEGGKQAEQLLQQKSVDATAGHGHSQVMDS